MEISLSIFLLFFLKSINYDFNFSNSHYDVSNFLNLKFVIIFFIKPVHECDSLYYQLNEFICDHLYDSNCPWMSFGSSCYVYAQSHLYKSHFTSLYPEKCWINVSCQPQLSCQHYLSLLLSYQRLLLLIRFERKMSHHLHRNHNHRRQLKSLEDLETKSCCPCTSV